MFSPRFPEGAITELATKYPKPEDDDEAIAAGKAAQDAGFLTREQFLTIARWKSPRPGPRHGQNDEATVREVTRFSLATPVEPLRLRSLTLLRGVGLRTASSILHLAHRERYPLMDVRAFWALGLDTMPPDLEAVWPEYVSTCRSIAARAGIKMRTLDRALWAFAAEHNAAAKWE